MGTKIVFFPLFSKLIGIKMHHLLLQTSSTGVKPYRNRCKRLSFAGRNDLYRKSKQYLSQGETISFAVCDD